MRLCSVKTASVRAGRTQKTLLELTPRHPCRRVIGVRETELAHCRTCADTRVLILPTIDDVEEHPCPTCRPWSRGFGGLFARRGAVLICLIHPAQPNEQAIKHTEQERHENVTK